MSKQTHKAIVRAMKGFEKRGLAPRWDQSLTIFEAGSKSTAAIERRSIRPASYQQTFTDGSYELTLITLQQ